MSEDPRSSVSQGASSTGRSRVTPEGQAFAKDLSREAQLLLHVRDELYEGSWDELVTDLEARRDRKPFIFKLNARIDDDLGRIAQLRAYEREHQVDLRACLPRAPEPELRSEEGKTQ